MYEKMLALGYKEKQIDVVYYKGPPSGITVGGKDIVNMNATSDNIQAIIDKYKREMNPSCTLALFVTDHGTGYDGGVWRGERPVVSDKSEVGPGTKTYAEKTFSVDGNGWLWDTVEFEDTGKKYKYAKHRYTGEIRLYLREGDTWVNKGNDTDGDGFVEEHEVGVDINGNGNSTDNWGFNIAALHAAAGHRIGRWDTDKDGTDDKNVRFKWDGATKKLTIEQHKDGTWQKMGEDANGDGKIDGDDGGIDWNLDGNKNGQAGFHEGICLLGNKTLWDDEFAKMLKPLKDMGVHINCIMLQCFSGGFAQNLTGIAETIFTCASEDAVSWTYRKDGKFTDFGPMEFLKQLKGIDPESWKTAWTAGQKADQKAWEDITAGDPADEKNKYKNDFQSAGTPKIESKTTYDRHKDGMYSICLRLPTDKADKVHDFEIILGLQKPRWTVSLKEGVGFPEGLPEGLDSELIPGGVRVFSESPLGLAPLMVRMRAPEGTKITRIDLTDADHQTVGYTTPETETIPETNPIEAKLTVECESTEDKNTCQCTSIATLKASAKDPEGKSKVMLAEVYIDGQLANRTRFSEDTADKDTKATSDWSAVYTRGLGAGRHVARLKIRNSFGQETIKEVEFFCCEDSITMIPPSEASDRITLSAAAKAVIEGIAPDCIITLNVNWRATALPTKQLKLKAAWLRINGHVVDSSIAPQPKMPSPDDDDKNGPGPLDLIPFFSWMGGLFAGPVPPDVPEPTVGNSDKSLGGSYSCPAEPGSTVLIEVIALGSDCKYYIGAWQKKIPLCPDKSGATDGDGGGAAPCFGADTLVLMADGSNRRIADIQTGNKVKAYDSEAREMVVKPVVATNSGQANYYYLINGNLKVTPPHPFFTVDRGWVPVEDLTVGDQVKAIDGTTVITAIEMVDEEQAIYNINVEELGNFFVSADGEDFYLVQEGSLHKGR